MTLGDLDRYIGRLCGSEFECSVFRPRFVELTEFMVGDEIVDKVEEWFVDECVELERAPVGVEELRALSVECPVVAVDVSSLRIGETDRGIFAAYRVAVVEFNRENVSVERFGPYIFHLSEDNKLDYYVEFRGKLGLPGEPRRLPSLWKMVDRVRNFIERLFQRELCRVYRDAILLWDGSLTGGTVDTPMDVLSVSLEIAHENGDHVVGVSKVSRVKGPDGRALINLLEDERRACFMDVHDLLSPNLRSRCLGRVLVVKFSPLGFTFRVDVAACRDEDFRVVLGKVASTCGMYGYPEPLRKAHVYAYLTANEVLALQSYIVAKYGLTVLKPYDIRKVIFGPFG